MCGIAGYLDKRTSDAPIGRTMLAMLQALGQRGPDSAGMALFGPANPNGEICLVKLPERQDPDAAEKRLTERLAGLATINSRRRIGDVIRLEVERSADVRDFCAAIERRDDGFEVLSLGTSLELTKQVGAPGNLDTTFDVGAFRGSHGIGHTRLSTESKVDLSHSQPFWARGVPDLATVHNGHITNYDRMRRRFEQRGLRFFTHNDSEVIAVYLADQLDQGLTLDDAVARSLDDFDGSFTYLVATTTAFGYARDPFALKPLIIVDTPDYVAVANEEVAIRSALGPAGVAREPSGHVYRIWQVGGEAADAAA